MDRCGTLLLRDVPSNDRDTLSAYKESILNSREINMSDCPACVLELLETGEMETAMLNRDQRRELQEFLNGTDEGEKPVSVRNKQRRETRFDRINKLMNLFPDGRITTVSVDTENRFVYCGRSYRIDPGVECYAPRHTRYGDQYDMDRVMVIERGDGSLYFADQEANPIHESMVYDMGEIN